jgi:hypothetical protein
MSDATTSNEPVLGTPEYDAKMAEIGSKVPISDSNAGVINDPTSTTDERPQWLPEKFKTPEELVKSYQELESKLGKPKGAPSPNEEPKQEPEGKPEGKPEGQPQDDSPDFSKYEQEFVSTGNLSEESIAEITDKYKLPKQYVQTYIAGLQALASQQTAQGFSLVGGEENYTAMTEWAKVNLSPQEIQAYDSQVTSGNLESAKFAIQALYSRYKAAVGDAPNLISGNTGQPSSNGFKSRAEITSAMSDPRYAKDPAYRKEVMDKIAVTPDEVWKG